MKLKVKKLHNNAILPVYASDGAAGMDLHACIEDDFAIDAGESAIVSTGLAIELPDNIYAEVRGRSGMAFKYAVDAFPGVIDSDYRGEIKVRLTNHSKVKYVVKHGIRIAQLIVNAAVVKCRPEWASDLEETKRGEGGFGSTGDKEIEREIVETVATMQTFFPGGEGPTVEETLDVLLKHSMGKK